MCLFFKVEKIDFASSYADDDTPFVSGYRLDDVLDSLDKASSKLFGMFSNNLLTSYTTSIAIKIKYNETLNSESEKLLGMTIDNKLNFNNHLQKNA